MDLIEWWYRALATPQGIVLAVSDVEVAKQKLYQARAKAQDPLLSEVAIRVSPANPTGELWLVKQKPLSSQPEPNTKPGSPESGSDAGAVLPQRSDSAA